MPSGSPNVSLEEMEEMLQRFIRFHSPVKLFPVLESEENLWYVAEYLVTVRHYRLLTPAMERTLGTVDRRMFQAGLTGRAT